MTLSLSIYIFINGYMIHITVPFVQGWLPGHTYIGDLYYYGRLDPDQKGLFGAHTSCISRKWLMIGTYS